MLISSQVYLEDICMSKLYMTLEDFAKHQNPGVRQDPYKYKIINIYDVFGTTSEDITLEQAKELCTKVYLDVKDFPEELMNCKIYNIEPDIDHDTRCLYLKIVII